MRSRKVVELFATLSGQLKVKLTLVEELPTVNEAKLAFAEWVVVGFIDKSLYLKGAAEDGRAPTEELPLQFEGPVSVNTVDDKTFVFAFKFRGVPRSGGATCL